MKFVQNYYSETEIDIDLYGALSPNEIREHRKFLGLTQVEASNLCGGGPNAFSRYECGKAKPSRATCNLLLMLKRMNEKQRNSLRSIESAKSDC